MTTTQQDPVFVCGERRKGLQGIKVKLNDFIDAVQIAHPFLIEKYAAKVTIQTLMRCPFGLYA